MKYIIITYDVISRKFCNSSYSRPPWWFPVHMWRYREKQQNVSLLFVYFISHYQITTERQEYQHTHSDEISYPSMKKIESSSYFCCFFPYCAVQKETKRFWKIVHVEVRTASCKPSIGVCTTRYALTCARFCNISGFPFVQRCMKKNNKKRLNFRYT